MTDSARLLRARFDRALENAELGLTAGEARALFHVQFHEPSRQTALAARMGVEPMTLVGFLDRLEAAELVVREPDPTDRRAKIVRLTERAQPLLKRVMEVTRGVRAAALKDFSPDEIEMFRAMLARLRTRLMEDEHHGVAP
ncbi:MarR family winged helix-turn-helix transcriptional regulator [Azospirillum soli]|uniref:MarR family winged helix-turn-helix transcriptional regulator n=1 Tax=Azospirillum soli TaxID=1304799 RepID=UPI001FE2A763|nr:MarR family transcriptional regulator [Azospirillum soli]MBP2315894.1 DNA-binding MarR family transcriptional regulator [Azospirillum soli]